MLAIRVFNKILLEIALNLALILQRIDTVFIMKFQRKDLLQSAQTHNLVFIHIPKTAGRSVLKALNLRKANHLNYDAYHTLVSEKNQKLTYFAIIREPAERFESTVSYLLNGGNQSLKDKILKLALESQVTHGILAVDELFASSTFNKITIFKPQTYFIGTSKNLQKIQLVNFQNLPSALVNKQWWPTDKLLPHVNRSRRRIALNSTQRRLIRKHYKSDYYLLNGVTDEEAIL